MSRNFFTDKWVLGAIAFLIVFGVACILWYHNDTAPYRKSAAETVELLRQWTVENAAPIDKVVEEADMNTKNSIPTADKPESKTTKDVSVVNTNSNSPLSNTSDKEQEMVSVEGVRVSPFGFGPYPELPVGWPHDTFPAPSAEHELQQRVRIDLLAHGIPVEGTIMENGLVYPVVKGIVYVKWKSYWRPTGKVTYISRIGGHPDDTMPIEMIRREKGKSFTKKDIPSDIKLLSFEEDGIDPYQFLELP